MKINMYNSQTKTKLPLRKRHMLDYISEQIEIDEKERKPGSEKVYIRHSDYVSRRVAVFMDAKQRLFRN